jgi:hypothetical protein
MGLLGIALMLIGFLIMYVGASVGQDNYGAFSPEMEPARRRAWQAIGWGS